MFIYSITVKGPASLMAAGGGAEKAECDDGWMKVEKGNRVEVDDGRKFPCHAADEDESWVY